MTEYKPQLHTIPNPDTFCRYDPNSIVVNPNSDVAAYWTEGTMTARYVSDFGGKKILAPLVTAAVLSPMAEGLNQALIARPVANILWSQLGVTSTPNQEYIAGILSDMPILSEFVSSNRVHAFEDPQLADALTTTNDIEISQGLFGAAPRLIPPKDILKLIERDINIGSALIGSAAILNALNNEEQSDSRLLQLTTDAHGFYGTVNDLIGFDALSMALRSRAYLISLRKLFQQKSIDAAEDMLADVGDRDSYATNTAEMLSMLSGGKDIEVSFPISDTTGHGIIYSEIDIGDYEAKGRVKSKGSLALKFSRGRIPMDVNGTALVTADDTELAIRYGEYVARAKKLHEMGKIILQAPPRKSSPFSIQGRPKFINGVLRISGLDRNHVWVIPNDSKDGYETAKLTFFQPASVSGKDRLIRNELKFETLESRYLSRVGKPAHIYYEACKRDGITEIKPKHLRKIHDRRHHLNSGDITEASKARGEELLKLIHEMSSGS